MVLFGFLVIGVGAVLVVAAIFTADVQANSGGVTAEFLSLDVSPFVLFLLGLIAGVCILWGFSFTKYGAKRSWRLRKERNELEELNQKLDSVDGGRRDEHDHE